MSFATYGICGLIRVIVVYQRMLRQRNVSKTRVGARIAQMAACVFVGCVVVVVFKLVCVCVCDFGCGCVYVCVSLC